MQRLVDLPEEFDSPPDEILQQLREIDLEAELVGVSPGFWWAGIVKPLSERVQGGRRELARLQKDGREKKDPRWWPKIRNALLKTQGFGVVCKHQFGLGEVGWGLIVEDFRYRCWWYLQYQEGDQDLRLAIEGELEEDFAARSRAAVIEAMAGDPRYLFKRIMQQNPAGTPVGVDL